MSDLFDIPVAKDGQEFILGSDGINWSWYLKVKVVWPHGRMRVEILKHWRVHKGDGGHPETVGSYNLLENTSRTVCAVEISFKEKVQTTCAVENPAYVFSYED